MSTVYILDVGNTAIKLLRFKNGQAGSLSRFAPSEWDECLAMLRQERNAPIAVAGSKSISPEAWKQLTAEFTTIEIDSSTPVPIRSSYRSMSTLGVDRLANAVYASARQGETETSLIIDLGTCITYDLVRGREYLGGMISPGLRMRIKAMHAFTERLPEVELNENVPWLGRDTTESLQSGAFHGWVKEIEGIVAGYTMKYPGVRMIYTGGDSPYFAAANKSAIFADPLWTLRGYHEIHRFNAR